MIERKPRGPQCFAKVTYPEIARLSGLSLRTVQGDAHERKVKLGDEGKTYPAKYDPNDLLSVAKYLLRRGVV